VLPCLPPHGGPLTLAVEGVSLKRQRGRAPVEVLYHSKRHHGPPSSSSISPFPVERVHLSSAPGPGGLTYNLTLLQLQPDDSALYSCQLLLRGEPDASSGLGRRALFVSVQGGSRHRGTGWPSLRIKNLDLSFSGSLNMKRNKHIVKLTVVLLCFTLVLHAVVSVSDHSSFTNDVRVCNFSEDSTGVHSCHVNSQAVLLLLAFFLFFPK